MLKHDKLAILNRGLIGGCLGKVWGEYEMDKDGHTASVGALEGVLLMLLRQS
jgi:hypothetical protein